MADRSACRRASWPVKISNSQRPSSSNHSTRHCPGVWRSSKTLAGSAPGWLVFVIMSLAPNDRKLASFAGLLLRLHLVDGASRVNVEAGLAVQRSFAMPIERRGADAALRYGFRATRWVFEGAHTLLTPSTLVSHQSQTSRGVTDLYGLACSCRST